MIEIGALCFHRRIKRVCEDRLCRPGLETCGVREYWTIILLVQFLSRFSDPGQTRATAICAESQGRLSPGAT
jgi:hypothetical protein